MNDSIVQRQAKKKAEMDAAIEAQQALLLQSVIPDTTGTARFSVKISPEAEALIAELNEVAKAENENAERFFSPDMKYAAYISESLDPFIERSIINGTYIADGPQYINGIDLIELTTEQVHQLVRPNQEMTGEYISNIEWNLESNAIYFTSNNGTIGSCEVYRCDTRTGKITLISDGSLCGLILDAPHIGFIKVMKSCFVEGKGGRHWYLAAISPDGKTEIKLSEPSLDMPEIN
ncbi:hypothetical protein [Alistipes shahii]|uniref:hypothetical protein n=1 Tax=Alistipes shahii TaxID=328814 RepID=UPI003219E5F2